MGKKVYQLQRRFLSLYQLKLLSMITNKIRQKRMGRNFLRQKGQKLANFERAKKVASFFM